MRILLDTYEHVRHLSALQLPHEVQESSKQYMEDNNPVGVWLRENFEVTHNEEDIILAEQLYTLYKNNVDKNMTKTAFGKSITDLNGIAKKVLHINHNTTKSYFVGIKIYSTEDDED